MSAASPDHTRRAATTVGVLVVVFVVSVAIGDLADDAHSWWRDPLSFFGSPESRYPLVTNSALVALGFGVFAMNVAGRGFPGPVRLGFGLIGICLAGLGLWSIDCSPVDELCERLIRGRAVSTSHHVHSVLAVGLLVGLVVVAAAPLWRVRGEARRFGVASVAPLLFAIGGAAAIVVRPFAAGLGAWEALVVVAAVGGVLVHWRTRHNLAL